MTDLKNLIEITFPDDGVSVLYVLLCIFFNFYFLFLFFLFLFIVGVGRPLGGDTGEYYPYAVAAAISAKEGKLNIYIIYTLCYYVLTSICFNVYMF